MEIDSSPFSSCQLLAKVYVNHLALILARNSVVRLTDHPNMTILLFTMGMKQQNNNNNVGPIHILWHHLDAAADLRSRS